MKIQVPFFMAYTKLVKNSGSGYELIAKELAVNGGVAFVFFVLFTLLRHIML